jgi:transcriptional regulator with PAS, ATPase and Fis domain|tara:strand:- start:1524 stop:1751 length:228 start_codon:yes stop_codon:yes gene_type:complete
MTTYKNEQDGLWEALGEAFPKTNLQTNLNNEVAQLEIERISEALREHDGNQTKAAKALDLGRVTFIAKAKKYELV